MKKVLVCAICLMLVLMPVVSARAGSATSGTYQYTDPHGTIYNGYARITTNSQVIGSATIKKITGPAPSGYMGVNAHILNSSDQVIASSGTIYNSGSVQSQGTSVRLTSPTVGNSYRAKGTFRVLDCGTYYSFSTHKTPFQTFYGTKGEDNILTDDRKNSWDSLKGWYAVNENGEYYGSISALDELAGKGIELDLVEAKNQEGTEGFIRLSEQGFYCRDKEEIELWSRKQESVRFVNLYSEDGKTVIGQFELSPASIGKCEGN